MVATAVIDSKFGPILVIPNDFIISRSLLNGRYWALQDINLLIEIVKHLRESRDVVTVYDVGANLGTHTLALAKTFGAGVRLRSFEAQRQLYYMLCGTVALNNLTNVRCENVVVSDGSSNRVTFQLPDYSKENNLGSFEVVAPLRSDNSSMYKSEFDTVEVRTIDSYGESVDVLKLDIEGMEDSALRGALVTLKKHRPVCFVEIYKTDASYVYALFVGLGYRGYRRGMDLIAIPNEVLIAALEAERVF